MTKKLCGVVQQILHEMLIDSAEEISVYKAGMLKVDSLNMETG